MADRKPSPCIVKWILFTWYLKSPPFGRAVFGSAPFGRAIILREGRYCILQYFCVTTPSSPSNWKIQDKTWAWNRMLIYINAKIVLLPFEKSNSSMFYHPTDLGWVISTLLSMLMMTWLTNSIELVGDIWWCHIFRTCLGQPMVRYFPEKSEFFQTSFVVQRFENYAVPTKHVFWSGGCRTVCGIWNLVIIWLASPFCDWLI